MVCFSVVVVVAIIDGVLVGVSVFVVSAIAAVADDVVSTSVPAIVVVVA